MAPRRVLADTHVFIWFVEDNPRLSPTVRTLLMDPLCEVWFSIASAWEMTIKAAQGKLDLGQPLKTLLPTQLAQNRFRLLPVELSHLDVLGTLPLHHRDPFDRLIIAQSIAEEMPLLSADNAFEAYVPLGLTLLWESTPDESTNEIEDV